MKNQTQVQKKNEETSVKTTLEVVIPEEKNKTGLQKGAEDVTPLPVVKQLLTIEELKWKAEQLTILSEKYDKFVSNLRKMENFEIGHDSNQSEIVIKDSQGAIFRSNSENAIKKFLEVCKSEYKVQISEIENKMREIA